MEKGNLEHLETAIVDLIQTKIRMKVIGKLDWTVENALNTIMVDELSNLRQLLLKKRRREPKPALFAIPPQQPPTPVELDLEL